MLVAEPLSLQLSVERIESRERLHALIDSWHRLWRRCPEAGVAEQPALALRCDALTPPAECHVLALFGAERLVGLVPLVRVTEENVRTLRLFPDEAGGTLEAMIEPGCERAASAAIFDYLVRHASEWDVCDFAQLRPGSVLLSPEVPLSWTDRMEEDARASDGRILYRRVLRQTA